MNILIVKLSAIGDVLHTLPSLAALRNLYPDAHITWVVEETAADLLKSHPLLNRVIISRRKSWIKDLQHGRLRKFVREVRLFVKELRHLPYDLVIDFHGLLKSSLIVLISGGRRKLGYDSLQELSGIFLNEKISEDMSKHAVDRYLDFARHLGADANKIEFILPLNENTEKKALCFFEKYGLEKNKFIAINPFALWETKLWDNENFARLADLIIDKFPVKVVFTGSEKEALKKITDRMSSSAAINLAGETTLIDLAHLYRRALMVISTDSGPMHLAAALGTRVIALFGPTDSTRTGPYGQDHKIIRADLPCSPCFLKKCSTKKCMSDILPTQVLAAVDKFLSLEK